MEHRDTPAWVLNLVSALRGASYLRLMDAAGTELDLVIEGRSFEVGLYTDQAATAWVSPVEYLGEGTLNGICRGVEVSVELESGAVVRASSPDPEINRLLGRLLDEGPEGRRVRLFGWKLSTPSEGAAPKPLLSAFLALGLYPQPSPECAAADCNFVVEVAKPVLHVYTVDGTGLGILDGGVELI